MAKPDYWDFPRSITSIVELIHVAHQYGLSTQECLKGTNIPPHKLQHPSAMISAHQELHLISNLLTILGNDTPLGLEAGSRNHIATFGAYGLAVLSSPTFYEAVEVGTRYIQLSSTYCHITGVVSGNEASLRVDDSELPESLRSFLLERDIATLMTLQKDLDPVNLPVHALRMKRAPTHYTEKFHELFNVTPDFNQNNNDVVLDRHRLKLKLPQRNELTQKYFEQQCQTLLRKLPSNSLSASIRHRLLKDTANMPSFIKLAEECIMHPKKLRRQLSEEGTNFDQLVSEVKQSMALELLIKTNLSIEQISDRLGYSEASAFSRAFKRWYHMSPRKYLKESSH